MSDLISMGRRVCVIVWFAHIMAAGSGYPLEQSSDLVREAIRRLKNEQVEVRERATRTLKNLLSQKNGQVGVFRDIHLAWDIANDPEVKLRLKNILRPYMKGGTVWMRDFGVPIDSILTQDEKQNAVILVLRKNYPTDLRLAAVHIQTGALLWVSPVSLGKYPLKGRLIGSNYIFSSGDHKLSSFSILDGSRNWSVKAKRSFSAPKITKTRILVGGYGKFCCFDRERGRLRWSILGEKWMSYPHVHASRVFLNDDQNRLLCASLLDGKIIWSKPGLDVARGVIRELLICGHSYESHVRARRISDGKETWTWKLPKRRRGNVAKMDRDRVAICSYERDHKSGGVGIPGMPIKRKLHILSGIEGRELWSMDVKHSGPFMEHFQKGIIRIGIKAYKVEDGRETDRPPPSENNRFSAQGFSFQHDPPEYDNQKAATQLRAIRLNGLDEKN